MVYKILYYPPLPKPGDQNFTENLDYLPNLTGSDVFMSLHFGKAFVVCRDEL